MTLRITELFSEKDRVYLSTIFEILENFFDYMTATFLIEMHKSQNSASQSSLL